MSSTSAKKSFKFAFQRELVKLYLIIFVGILVLNAIQGAFSFMTRMFIRESIILLFRVIGWGSVLGGIVGVLHFVFVETTAAPSD